MQTIECFAILCWRTPNSKQCCKYLCRVFKIIKNEECYLHPFVEIRNEAISLLTLKNITKVNSQWFFVDAE